MSELSKGQTSGDPAEEESQRRNADNRVKKVEKKVRTALFDESLGFSKDFHYFSMKFVFFNYFS